MKKTITFLIALLFLLNLSACNKNNINNENNDNGNNVIDNNNQNDNDNKNDGDNNKEPENTVVMPKSNLELLYMVGEWNNDTETLVFNEDNTGTYNAEHFTIEKPEDETTYSNYSLMVSENDPYYQVDVLDNCISLYYYDFSGDIPLPVTKFFYPTTDTYNEYFSNSKKSFMIGKWTSSNGTYEFREDNTYTFRDKTTGKWNISMDGKSLYLYESKKWFIVSIGFENEGWYTDTEGDKTIYKRK